VKTRLRWFWVALGAFLAIIGEEFLRKLLALSLCGVFLLSYCLPDAKYSAYVVAQTPQPAIGQSQTEQKIDNYFSPIQPDGTPKLGIDRWWATAGVDKEITVNWTVEIREKGDYYLNFPVSKINKNTKVIVLDSSNNVLNTIKTPIAPAYSGLTVWRLKKEDKDQDLEAGVYTLRIENFSVPVEPVVEEVKLALGTIKTTPLRTDGFGYDYQFNMTNELKTLFITDSQEVNQKYLIKVKEKSYNPQNQGNVFTEYVAKKELSKSQLINYFTPILSFEPKDEAQFPLDVNRTTWEKSKSKKSQLLPKGDSQGFLDLSEFKNKKITDTKFAKIYASVVEKEWQDKKSKQRISELAINYYFHYSQSNWQDYDGLNNHEGDWEGITLFLRKDVDNRYYPCRIAFAQHVSFAEVWKGGQVVEWSKLNFRTGDDIYHVTNVAQNPTKTQIYQPMVYVGLGGHASYPDGRSTNYDIKNPEQIGSTSHLWTGIEYHRGGNDINIKGKVEYLPRVGKGINTKEIQGKEWLLYPGTWGNPKNCSTKWLDFGCPSAHQGPVFIDVKLVGIGSRSVGLGKRWLDPWEWSKNFEGADKLKGCPPPQEEPKPEPTPDIPRKPDGNTGIIYGDPHIVTFDGLRNSFQAVGEFILAKSERGDFEVQGRFKGVGDNASLPSAVAIKAGGERIGIYQGKLKINARNVNEASFPIVLEGGARVDKNGGEYRIIAPTGEWVEVSGSSVLTIKVTVPKSRLSKMYGLLGNYNNSPNDDLKTRQGKVVGINPNYDQLYKEYGNSWRIPQPESLFAYEVGETSATFTNLNFPKKVLTLADFTTQQKQEAERVCRSAGVTASAMLESCMFDVLVTGDRSFANVSAYVQSEVKVTATVTPIESPKPQPSASNNGSINGKWIGKYTCAQGITGVTLTINQKGTEIIAEFELYPVPENPNLPRGIALFRGTFNLNTLEMSLKGVKWIQSPGAGWGIVDFSGKFDSSLNRFTGRKQHPGCGSIELVRATSKPTVPESQSGTSLISKTTGVNYTRLRDLLAAGKWEEANGETIKVVSRILWGKWEDIPCEDLRTINQLWLHYSNGKFGFSVQKEIYESLGGTRDYNEEVVEKLGDRVGWRKGGSWLYNYSDITFNLELAPKAHLPRFRNSGDWGEVSQRSLLKAILRANTCEL